MDFDNDNINKQNDNIAKSLAKYFSFWPFFLISFVTSIIISSFYLRYADYYYLTTAKIEIIDKAQDSDMALPTAMTIFNRSMINLENEIGVLNSYRLNKKVAQELQSNAKFFIAGRVKTSETHRSEWFDKYNLEFKIDLDSVINKTTYKITYLNGNLKISSFNDSDDLIDSYNFSNTSSTYGSKNNLPFDLSIDDISNIDSRERILKIYPLEKFVLDTKKNIKVTQTGKESEQLTLTYNHTNSKIAREYLDKLISLFGNGISIP